MDVWGGAFGSAWGNSWGLTVVVVTRTSGGSVFARMAKDSADLRRITAQIERDDEEILAVVLAAVQAGLIP